MFEKTKSTLIIKEVEIESLIESRLEYRGQETGRLYYWNKSGDVALVDERDVPELLKRRLGKKQCCGNGDGNYIFQLVGGNHA